MANDTLTPPELDNKVALGNGGMSKKVMVAGEEGSETPTVTNFRILSVRKHHDSRHRYNTVAVVEVDRFPELPKEVKSVKRYRRRKVPFTRIQLTEAFALAGFTQTETKAYQITTVESLEAVLAAILDKLNIAPEEVTFMKVNETVATLTAKPNSLGFLGRVTVTTGGGSEGGEGEHPEEPTGPAQWVKESVTKQAFILGDDGDGLNDLPALKPNGEMNFLGVRLTGEEAVANSKLRMKIDLEGNTHQEMFLEPFYRRPGGLISFGGFTVDAGVSPDAKAIISVQGDPAFPFVEIAQFPILPE